MAEIRLQLPALAPDEAPGYGLVAPLYFRNGFKPIPLIGKRPLVRGATGQSGAVTAEKIADWRSRFPQASIGLRAEGFITIDVDHHDSKLGAEQLASFEARFGTLPRTVSSTARGKTSASRQYFFRVREDTPLASDPSPDIEIVHKFHRYSVVAPSIHPELLTTYVWYGADGEEITRLPTLRDFALLPDAWLDGLSRTRTVSEHSGEFAGDLTDWIQWLGEVPPFLNVRHLREEIERTEHIGHDDLLRFVLRIQRARIEGEASLAPVFGALSDQFRQTTNNPDWAKELEDIVRWVIGANWNPNSHNQENQGEI